MKIVYLKPFERLLNCVFFGIFIRFNQNFRHCERPEEARQSRTAFSLVEMLMALLVASLLLAALAPVMTRKMNEHITLSTNGNGIKSDYSRIFYEDFEWNVPSGVNVIKVTSVGGGGAGGGATYGYKELVSSESNWTVPEGVTKLRVFMIGAGGGGASGGSGTDYEYADIPSLNNAEGEILTAGSYTFANGITPPSNYKAPELNNKCKISNISDKWTIVSNNTTISPNTKFAKFFDNTNITLNKVTACGGGGGGSSSSTNNGGSGGYTQERSLQFSSSPAAIKLVIGAPGTASGYVGGSGVISTRTVAGGAGGTGFSSEKAKNGGTSQFWCSNSNEGTGATGGGGGGGATGISIKEEELLIVSGGGGAGGDAMACWCYSYAGAGGKGGGPDGGIGGEGGRVTANCSYPAIIGGGTGVEQGQSRTGGWPWSYGGGGGAGKGGIGGGKGNLNSIFGSNNCNGGKPGAIHLWYSASSIKDGLKCQYYTKSNSGSGGGAGQIWIGELSVTPGEKLNFNIGIGGNRTTSYGANGNNGGSTSITNNNGTTLISVSGGKGGKYESDETYINNSYGIGGGIKTSNVDSSLAKYVNWKKTNFHTGGENGGVGKTPSNGAGGGKGGQLYDLNGTLLKGGIEGGAQSNGSDALITNYGTGGGGGGGVINDGGTPGLGGKGANGYIYVEWGKTNGGGGASGQIITENTVWVTPGTKIQITVGKGGEPKDVLSNNGQLGQKGNNGGDSFVTTNEGKKAVAKGGEGGYPGTSTHGMGGNYDGKDENGDTTGDKSPNYIENSVKGENGTDDYGGIGGTITEEICPLFDTLMGLGGCGGNMPNGNCNGASSTGAGKNAGKVGGGGGGGAVKDNTAYTGGKGANGMVVIEWNN